MEDKSYWKQFSSVEDGEYTLYIDSGNEGWALFKGEEFRADEKDLISAYEDRLVSPNNNGLMESLFSTGVPADVVGTLISAYLHFLFEEPTEEEHEAMLK